eukprot:1383746-Rhodomonas_salina.1
MSGADIPRGARTFAVDWPPNLVAMLSTASAIMQFDFLSFPGLTCMTNQIDFTFQLMFSTLVPVIGVLFLLLPIMWAIVFRRAVEPPRDIGEELEEQWKTLLEGRGKLDVERKEVDSMLRRLPTVDDNKVVAVAELRTRLEQRLEQLVAGEKMVQAENKKL